MKFFKSGRIRRLIVSVEKGIRGLIEIIRQKDVGEIDVSLKDYI